MAKGKVEKCTFVQEWEFQGKKNYNFVVKFEGSEDRYVYVGKDKDNPKFKEGEEIEYNLVEGKTIKVFVKDKSYEYSKIEAVKSNNGFGGGFGGGKSFVRTKEQELNLLLGTSASYAKDLICYRTTIGNGKDGKDLAKTHVEMTIEIFNGLKDLIQ